MKTNNNPNPKNNTQNDKQPAYKANPNIKKDSNNKKLIIGGIGMLLIISVIVGTIFLLQKNHKEALNKIALENNDLSSQLNERDSLISEWVTAFDEIEKDLNLMRDKEQLLEVKSDDKEFNKNKKEEILEDIQFINSLLESNKKKIESLNSRLKKSGIKIAGLQRKINELENSLNVRDSSINELKTVLADRDFQINHLNERMGDMEVRINQQEVFIDLQTNEMNKAYLAYGSYRELKDKGVITKDGGFLWIGQEKTLMENFSDKNFTEINIMETKTIPVHSKKVELITDHPQGSYDFVKDSTQAIAYLEIKDPLEFWKISKYAVLETK